MTQLASGHTVEVLEGEELEHQERDFQGYTNGLIRLNPGRWLYPADYTKFADNLFKFKFRESDSVVMTWPKCGTTWMQEIVWTLRNNPDLDHPLASLSVLARSPFLDLDMLMLSKNIPPLDDSNPLVEAFKVMCPGKDPKDGVMLQLAEAIPDPRTIKTHLPFSLLTPDLLDTAKVVYVARSPKDVVVSYFHHSRLILGHGYTGSLDQFVQYFLDDNLVYGPYWLHMKEAWEKRDHPNMHFVFFEDIKNNTMLELRKLNEFLNTNLTEEQLQKVAHYTSFSEMKSREEKNFVFESVFDKLVLSSDGGFFRKGVIGDGQKRLSPEQQAKVDQWTKEHTHDFGASFKYST
ncbi:sulfotransferase 1C4-like [Procambarus clarkii]|uniref:sulfotransferase 1C4-like n=1 Tax=Procambarus clarkii TaxID=6728 RepID=UPI003742C6C9